MRQFIYSSVAFSLILLICVFAGTLFSDDYEQGPVSSSATYSVISSDAAGIFQHGSQSVYLCDGTADDVQIQAAIDAAYADGGGIVNLSEGTFTLSAGVKLKSNVTLQGVGFATIVTVVNSPSGGVGVLYNNACGGSAYTDSNIIVRDMTVDGNEDGITGSPGIFHTIALGAIQNFKVEGVKIFEPDGAGVNVIGYSRNGYITRNTLIGPTNSTVAGGINIAQSAYTYGIAISENSVDNMFYGIFVASDNISISWNKCYSNHDDGIALVDGSDCTVTGNISYDNGYNGIIIEGSSGSTYSRNNAIVGNLCYGNGQDTYNGGDAGQIALGANSGTKIYARKCTVIGNVCRAAASEVNAPYHPIASATQGTKTFTVSGDYHHQFNNGDTCWVTGSTANDGTYTCNGNATYGGGVTSIVVNEALDDETADGNIRAYDIHGIRITTASPSDCIVANNVLLSSCSTDGVSLYNPLEAAISVQSNIGAAASGDILTTTLYCNHANITDGGGATGYMNFPVAIPAYSEILSVVVDCSEVFDSNNTTTLTAQVGTQADPDRFHDQSGGEDIENTDWDDGWKEVDIQDPSVLTTETTARITFTEDDDITDVISDPGAQGVMNITITYRKL